MNADNTNGSELLEAAHPPQTESAVQGTPDESAAATLFPVRFTSHEGLFGWLEAKWKRLPVYGSGALALADSKLSVNGWQRTWLGVPCQATLEYPIEAIRNAAHAGVRVQFEVTRNHWAPRTYEVAADSPETAARIVSTLPDTKTPSFERDWEELRDFDARLEVSPRSRQVTPLLVVTNVLAFVAMTLLYRRLGGFDTQQLLSWGANFGPRTMSGEGWRLFTAIFLHYSFAHLFFNMWALWNVGTLSERLWGRGTILFIYLASGIGGGLAGLLWDPQRFTIGASGAVFGVFGAFLALLTQKRFGIPRAVIKAHRLSTILFVGFNLLSGALSPATDNAAHFGGLVTGALLGWLLSAGKIGLGVSDRPARRNGFVEAAVTVVLITGYGALYIFNSKLTVPDRYDKDHAWFFNGESKTLNTFDQLLGRTNAGLASNLEIANTFEKDLQPFWSEALQKLKQEQGIEGEYRRYGEEILAYTQNRVDWIQAVINAYSDAGSTVTSRIDEYAAKVETSTARIQRLRIRATMGHAATGLADSRWVASISPIFRGSNKCVAYPYSQRLPLSRDDSKSDSPALGAADECDAQRMFIARDFSRLDSLMTKYLEEQANLPDGTWRLHNLKDGLNNLFAYGSQTPEELLSGTSAWRRQFPDSVHAEVVEAMLFEELAWRSRGAGTVKTVTPQGWAGFRRQVAMAAAALEEIAEQGANHPIWHELMLDVALDQGLDLDTIQARYTVAKSRFPSDDRLDRGVLRAMLPRWKGSYEQIDDFIIAEEDKENGLGQFERYAHLYDLLERIESSDLDFFTETRASWEYMVQGMKARVTRHPGSDLLLNRFAYMACRAGDAATYWNVRPLLKDRLSSSAWTSKDSITACDGKLPVRETLQSPDLFNRYR